MSSNTNRKGTINQYNIFGSIDKLDLNNNTLREEDPGIRVTCWYRKDPKTGDWKYNHYDEGWLNTVCPEPKFPGQKGWLRMEWRTKHRWLKDHTVIQMLRV